jgi:TatD DNase family protein
VIDIGANLAHKSFRRDLDGVLAGARAAGVHSIVATGTGIASSLAVHELTRARGDDAPALFSTAGVHPHEASTWSPESEAALRDLASQPRVVAIGECGLDFERNFSPPDAQTRCFEAQLALASELGLPVFLHERKAHDAFVQAVARFRPRLVGAVVHCFTGGQDELARYLDLGLHVGVTGWICDERRGQLLRQSVRSIPADHLMIETDAPFLLPRDLPREQRPGDGRNEPRFLPRVLQAVAAARGEDPDDIERATDTTARTFFRLEAAVRQPGPAGKQEGPPARSLLV